MVEIGNRVETASPAGPQAGRTADGDPRDVLGEMIRRQRKARGITLARLSELTGLSIGHLSQIERDISSPSVKALHDIGRALGVNISWFFDGGEKRTPGEGRYVVRAGSRRRVEFALGVTDDLLSPSLKGQLELLLSRLPPGASSGDAPYSHKGEEAGVVMAGTLELWIGDERFLLGQGDSFAFPSTRPHRYGNPGDVETVVVWAITPPSY